MYCDTDKEGNHSWGEEWVLVMNEKTNDKSVTTITMNNMKLDASQLLKHCMCWMTVSNITFTQKIIWCSHTQYTYKFLCKNYILERKKKTLRWTFIVV